MARARRNADPAATTYARALLELAEAQQQAETIGQELTQVQQAVAAEPAIEDFLRSPGISAEERAAVLQQALRGKVTPLLWNFVGVLNLRNRMGLLADIVAVYQELLDKLRNNVQVLATVARPLDAQLLEEVRKQISTALRMNATVEQAVDESIIGGMVLRLNGRLIDGSVRKQLELMKEKLLASAR